MSTDLQDEATATKGKGEPEGGTINKELCQEMMGKVAEYLNGELAG